MLDLFTYTMDKWNSLHDKKWLELTLNRLSVNNRMDTGSNTRRREDRKPNEYVASQMWFGGNDLLSLIACSREKAESRWVWPILEEFNMVIL